MDSQPLKVLVVDDSALYRKIVRSVLEELPDVQVVGAVCSGKQALERIGVERPDVVTLDFEMPDLDGLGVLRELSLRKDAPAAIMISAITTEGAKATNEALKLGALDFVVKPVAASPEASIQRIRADLAPKIEACRLALRKKAASPASAIKSAARPQTFSASPKSPSGGAPRQRPQIVGIGVSTGGPAALHRVLPLIPGDFPCPIVIVQHMPPLFTKSLADDLNRICKLKVLEGSDGLPLAPGEAVIAPGGKQMRVVRERSRAWIELTNDPPERNCRPSVDYLFRSLAVHYGYRTLAAILTGMGDDGTLGCKELKARGAAILAQDEASCVIYGMPRAVYEAGVVDAVLPLDQIAAHITAAASQGALV
jgi:two-component system chemotaxis response regulator CheB